MASSSDGNLMPRWLPAINRRIVNPIQRLWAPYLPFYALIEHRGRVSGSSYRTPVLALRRRDELVILLPYGDRVDWLRNVQAGPASVVRMGRRSPVIWAAVDEDRRIRRATLTLA